MNLTLSVRKIITTIELSKKEKDERIKNGKKLIQFVIL
jgi:hypothetical protein